MELTATIAQTLVLIFAGKIDFSIGVCDHHGIILADTAAERIGTFDESAYILLSQQKDLLTINKNDHYLGASPGLRFVLRSGNLAVGAVCLSGDPEKLLLIFPVLHVALEHQLAQELAISHSSINRGKWDSFRAGLLKEGGEFNDLPRLAGVFQLNTSILRVCILCIPDSNYNESEFCLTVRKRLSQQDIIFPEKNGRIILFHELISDANTLPSDYRAQIDEALTILREWFSKAGISVSFSVGSLQNDFAFYHKAYLHALWVMQNCCGENNLYFYDNISEYFKSLVPAAEIHAIFSVFIQTADPHFLETCQRVLEPLIRNNYNLVSSSKELFMHKNTLISQLNRIRSYLRVNPCQNAQQKGVHEFFLLLPKKSFRI